MCRSPDIEIDLHRIAEGESHIQPRHRIPLHART
jgi:hypothetical protein